jgi:hypothetical protein
MGPDGGPIQETIGGRIGIENQVRIGDIPEHFIPGLSPDAVPPRNPCPQTGQGGRTQPRDKMLLNVPDLGWVCLLWVHRQVTINQSRSRERGWQSMI